MGSRASTCAPSISLRCADVNDVSGTLNLPEKFEAAATSPGAVEEVPISPRAVPSATTEITTYDVVVAIKVITFVLLFAWMNSRRRKRTSRHQRIRSGRRQARGQSLERYGRAKISLNAGPRPGSKPQGGSS